MHEWSDAQFLEPGADLPRYICLPEDGGWGVLIAWCAGRHARFRPIGARATVHVDLDGTRWEWPRTPSDQREMDADVRAYCADAGIPPPPPGREWWIVRPDGLSDAQFFAELNAFVTREVPEARPMADREAVGAFLAGVYH